MKSCVKFHIWNWSGVCWAGMTINLRLAEKRMRRIKLGVVDDGERSIPKQCSYTLILVALNKELIISTTNWINSSENN